MAPSRFPPPWSAEEQPACFVVRDHTGQALAYVYFEDAGPTLSGKTAQQGRGASDRRQRGEAAGAIAQGSPVGCPAPDPPGAGN
jgi:hypothetical protein